MRALVCDTVSVRCEEIVDCGLRSWRSGCMLGNGMDEFESSRMAVLRLPRFVLAKWWQSISGWSLGRRPGHRSRFLERRIGYRRMSRGY